VPPSSSSPPHPPQTHFYRPLDHEALVTYNQFADMFCDLMVTNLKDSREDTLSIVGSQVHLVQLDQMQGFYAVFIYIVFLKERWKPF